MIFLFLKTFLVVDKGRYNCELINGISLCGSFMIKKTFSEKFRNNEITENYTDFSKKEIQSAVRSIKEDFASIVKIYYERALLLRGILFLA